MNQNAKQKNSSMKKIIAKEFLIMIAIISISLLSFLFTKGYNYFTQNEIKISKDSLENIHALSVQNINSLQYDYLNKIEKQNVVFFLAQKIYNNIGYGKKYETSHQFWNQLLEEDYESYTKNYNDHLPLWKDYQINYEENIYTYESFKKFVIENTVNEIEQKNYEDAVSKAKHRTLISNRITSLSIKLLSNKEINNYGLAIFLFLFIICFIVRYIFIAIKWSIKTLKT